MEENSEAEKKREEKVESLERPETGEASATEPGQDAPKREVSEGISNNSDETSMESSPEIVDSGDSQIGEAEKNLQKKLMIGFGFIFIVAVLYGGFVMWGGDGVTGNVVGSRGDISGEILAEVNGYTITSEFLDMAYALFFFMNGLPESYKASLSKDVFLNQTIIEQLTYEAGEKEGYGVSLDEAEAEFMKSLESAGIEVEEFKKEFDLKSFDYDFFIETFRKQMVIQNYLEAEVLNEISLDENEALDFYEENSAQFVTDAQVKASHILVETKEEAIEIIAELDGGADFAELAAEKSTGPSGPNGGDLGFFGGGAMVPAFEEAAFALENVGDYTSEAVETQFGFHVILLTDTREAGTLEFEEVKESLEAQILQGKEKEVITEYFEKTLAAADIEIF